LLHALRQIAPATPIAVLTAHPHNGATTAALRELADEFLEKPVSIAHLLTTATRLIQNGRT
jgi:DNA-binding response OmpR family regulator